MGKDPRLLRRQPSPPRRMPRVNCMKSTPVDFALTALNSTGCRVPRAGLRSILTVFLLLIQPIARLRETFHEESGFREARVLLFGQGVRPQAAKNRFGGCALRVQATDHARGLRGDDWQRQDGTMPVVAGRSGYRRNSGDGDRS